MRIQFVEMGFDVFEIRNAIIIETEQHWTPFAEAQQHIIQIARRTSITRRNQSLQHRSRWILSEPKKNVSDHAAFAASPNEKTQVGGTRKIDFSIVCSAEIADGDLRQTPTASHAPEQECDVMRMGSKQTERRDASHDTSECREVGIDQGQMKLALLLHVGQPCHIPESDGEMEQRGEGVRDACEDISRTAVDRNSAEVHDSWPFRPKKARERCRWKKARPEIKHSQVLRTMLNCRDD